MFISCRCAALALPIRAFTCASDPPCSSMMLPRYVKVFTSSKSSPSSVIRLVRAVLYQKILLFPLCMLEPAVVTLLVSCICRYVCVGRARSSVKFESFSCVLAATCRASPQVLTSS
ncbi:unnamed protein product [Schistosoma mattheei]|uniref:Uncharacterized protein n=1 Tax=Schistosoma mattheei TaxID=31246 RepID=A0A183PK57_9TREM|nr:unnamed protein product [Schistosoma mattheei]